MIDLSPPHLDLIKQILMAHLPSDAHVWVFGSRARGDAKPFSDVDLAIDAAHPLTLVCLAKMNDAFEESL